MLTVGLCAELLLQVLRARMQDARGPVRQTLPALVRSIIKHEGFRSLWTGFKVNMVRVVPSCVATFVSYEMMAR